MAREYSAFISYRHRPLDIAVAMKVHKCIERFKIPRDLRREEQKNPGSVFKNWDGMPLQKLVVFRDRDELPLSNDLTSDIFDALDNARSLIVICTPDTPKSLWVRREISHFIEKHGRKRIITVLAAGTPEESIPKEITTKYAEDGVTVLEEYEPLVAYLVDDSQRKILRNLDKEKLRVCAAILGCAFDSLKQRHKRRRMRQMLMASAAAFLVALSFIGMLVNRNREITAQKNLVEFQKQQVEEQKRMVQLRESELLAADAREALDMGDTREAIESAVEALPKKGEEDRPYYAPAESVLMEAMDVMGGAEDHVIIRDTVMDQMTPISHLALSKSGTLAATIDKYGVVHCYDTVTGEEKWSQVMGISETSITGSHVQITADESCLICRCGDVLEGRDLQTGRLLWNYEMQYAVTGYFIYDEVQNRIAILRWYSAAQVGYLLEAEIISAATGAVESNILLEQTQQQQSRFFYKTGQRRLPTGGAFSQDGRYFACAFSRTHEEEGKSWLDCFVVDLQEGTVVSHCAQEVLIRSFYVSGMQFREDGVLIALEVGEETVAGSLLKLDWQNNRILWQTTTPAELQSSLLTSDLTSHILFWDHYAYLGRFRKIYCIDLQTGEILSAAQVPGNLTSLYAAGENYFGYSLDDGSNAIGWFNLDTGLILTTDDLLYLTVSVGAHDLISSWGGGIVQQYLDGGYLEISISNVDRPGYLAIVPEETPNRLIIKRPITVEKTIGPSPITVPLDYSNLYCASSECVVLRDNTVIMGQFYCRDENWNNHYFHVLLDPVTHELKRIIETEDTDQKQSFFLADGSGWLSQDREGKLVLVRNEKETLLAEQVDPHYSEEQQTFVRGMVTTDNTYLTDGTVMSVHSDTENLTIFKDGVETAVARLPETHQYSEELPIGVQRYVQAGRNGYVVTHLTRLLQSVSASDVAVYNVETGAWMQLALTEPLTNTNAYAFAEKNPLFAAVDGKHMVRVLNLQTGREEAAFPLQLPCSSVVQMDFLLDDSCLMVKTREATVMVYDISTGEILLHDQLDTIFQGSLTAWEDVATQRLYILDCDLYGTNALCIDLRSWTVLARAENVVCFLPQTKELYFVDTSHGTTEPQFFHFQVPDTAALVRMGQQMLEAQ